MEQKILERAQKWLDGNYDAETKKQVKYLIDNSPKELTESFYRDLEFGTGGLRGIMGVGTNRMNIYTVGMATQGLANYVNACFAGEEIKVAIAYDCRNLSREFAARVADIFASNGFKVFLFDSLRPTPELSFAIRKLGCKSGVMVTASHNPKEYNGYKAYWEDGSQVIAPHDTNIIDEVGRITSIDQIISGKNPENITIIGEEFDKLYINEVHTLSLSPAAVKQFHDMKIVYTPLHGCGYKLVPDSLRKFGFTNISLVPEQAVIDGNFPTVESPNPEERSTMKMAIELAEKVKAEIALATDPDSDRIGIAVPDDDGNYVLLNGNQTCVLLTYYMCRRWKDNGMIDGRQYIVKTIVTSEMMQDVAKAFGVKCFECLTGFKYIAKVIREQEVLGKIYIGGGEESFGFLPGSFLRDKDGVAACSLAAEAAAWAKSNGTTLYGLIKELYVEFGFYKEGLVSVVRKGKEGQEEIAQMMVDYRANPPKTICGSQVVIIKDYQKREELDVLTGKTTPITIDQSNVLQYLTADKTIVSIRPSGTEPKIKYYFGVCEQLGSVADYNKVNEKLEEKITQMKKELNLV